MSDQTTDTDDLFFNDFHRRHYEECMKENARVQSMCFSPEYARAQSQRMAELVRKEREESRKRKKKSSKDGQ